MSLRRLPPFVLLFLAVVAFAPLNAADVRRATKAEESEARLKRDVTYLASDECEGRGPTTAGLKKAGDYIAEEFRKAGLKPGNPDGTYFQTFTIPGAILEEPAVLTFLGPDKKVIELKQGVHFHPMALGAAGKLADAPVVFAGFGMTTKPKNDKDTTPDYDDYAGLDVAGKVVIVFRDVPQTADTKKFPERSTYRQNATFTRKLINADEHKAAAVIFVNDAETAKTGDDLLDFNFTAVGGQRPARTVEGKPVEVALPAFHMKREVLEQLLKSADANLGKVETAIDKELQPHSLDLKGWTANLEVKMKRDKLPLRNVIGVLEGKGPLANETIYVGSHYDHLGYGGSGGSLARIKKMVIHHGADDNGSGSTAVMELARRLAAVPERQGRRVVFMTFAGEELGLLGSAHYAAHPFFPHKDTVFMLNLDMVGRLKPDTNPKYHVFGIPVLNTKDQLLTEGIGTGKGFEKLLDEWNKKYDFALKKTAAAIPYSDHYSFYKEKVPVLFFWTGYHEDYHRPTDTADKINVPGMRRIVDLTDEVLNYFASTNERPEWQEVKSAGPTRPGRNGPTLGFVPQFGSEDGVGVDEVRDGPGAKAGLKKGDKIVEISKMPVKTLEGYTQIMSTLKAGDTINVVVVRDGTKVTLTVKLE